MTARFRNPDKILHELQGFLGQMDAVLWVAVFEHTRQARHGAADRHISVRAPDDIFCLLTKRPFCGREFPLSHTAMPRQIQPAHWSASLAQGSCRQSMNIQTGAPGLAARLQEVQPPAAQRVHDPLIPWRRRQNQAAHCRPCWNISLRWLWSFLRLCAATGRIRRICDDSVKRCREESSPAL